MIVEAVKARFRAFLTPAGLLGAALAIAAGGGIGIVAGRMVAEPHRKLGELRFKAQTVMFKLHDLQRDFRRAKGQYANGLDALLASTPEGPAIRKELSERVDMNTLVVKGDAKAFRLEANILDPERTLIKLKGP